MTTEREQMTDEWLRHQFNQATSVASLRSLDDEEGIKSLLRGFANRVLQGFGDRQGMYEALNIGYTRHKEEQTKAQKDAIDAERYRWLRENAYMEFKHGSPRIAGWAPSFVDEAVDKAMAE